MKTSKRTKAVMVGHAVCIEQPRPEWEAVKWKFATVLQGWEALASLCTNGYLKQGEHSDRLRAALERRVQRLIGEVGALDRADRSRTARIAFAARYGLHNSCTALVPVDGRAS